MNETKEMYKIWRNTNISTSLALFLGLPAVLAYKNSTILMFFMGIISTIWMLSLLKREHYYSESIQDCVDDYMLAEQKLKNIEQKGNSTQKQLSLLDKYSYQVLTKDELAQADDKPIIRLEMLVAHLTKTSKEPQKEQTPLEIAETSPTPH